MGGYTYQFDLLHAGSGGDDRGWRSGAYRAARQLETACLPPPSALLRSVSALFPPPPLSSLSFSLLLLNPSPFPHSPLPRFTTSVARAPFPSIPAAAGSHLASPPPPVRPRNRRIRWCFSAASASAAGRPLAALPAALRPSLR